MKINTIISVSFLHRGERKIVKADSKGRFRVPVSEVRLGRLKTDYKNLTAMQLIKHDVIKSCDPVLTLNSGEKVRVYHGGDNTYFPARSEGLILKHDDFHKEKTQENKPKAKTIVPPYNPSTSGVQLNFPWYDEEYDEDDIF